jgi:hypothetical protein
MSCMTGNMSQVCSWILCLTHVLSSVRCFVAVIDNFVENVMPFPRVERILPI